MPLYHVNPESGDTGICQATSSRTCPFGEANHSIERDLARKIYENNMEAKTFLKPVRTISLTNKKIFPILSAAPREKPFRELDLEEVQEECKNRAILCPDCGSPLGGKWAGVCAINMETAEEAGYCFNCHEMFDSMDAPPIQENPDSPTYAAIVDENIPKMIWYHYTDRKNWAEEILSDYDRPKFVHLGGEQAAADRGLSYLSGDRQGYMYAVEVTDIDGLDPNIFDDDGSDFVPRDDSQIVRYRNRYEDTGSISLAVNPSKVRIIGRATVLKEDLTRVTTYEYRVPSQLFYSEEGMTEEELERRIQEDIAGFKKAA